MTKYSGVFILALIVCLLSACSVDLPQPQASPTQAPARQTTAPALTPPSAATALALPKTSVPVTWGALKLQGKLVFLNAVQKENNSVLAIKQLDLASGDLYTLFQGPEMAWIYSMAVAPDASRLVMSYTPPYAKGVQPIQMLYQMPLDGSAQPQALFPIADPADQYLQPEWSPDGKYLYYTHVNYRATPKDQHYPNVEVFRILFPDGKPEKIADKAFWARFSRDGKRLAYIYSDTDTGKNKLFVADPDGKNAVEVAMSGAVVPDIIDAPIFSGDGQTIYFSAPSPQTATVPWAATVPLWWERLLGITVAEAHNVPSEWWSVPTAGGEVRQLTHLGQTGLFASLAPDAQHIASYSSNILLVLNPDLSGATQIFNEVGGAYGTVNWIP
jgi:hypothetical protein